MWGFIIWDLLLIALFIITFFYRSDERKRCKEEKAKLWMFYGVSMFIADYFLRKIVVSNIEKIIKRIKEINAKERVEWEAYIYVVDKIAMAVFIIYISSFMGTVIKFNYIRDNKEINEILREEKIDKEMRIKAYISGEEETLLIDIMPKEYTEAKVQEILQDVGEKLGRIMLGANESFEKVDSNLNLCNVVGDDRVSVSWESSDKSIIDDEGIIGEGVSEGGTEVELTAVLTFKNCTKEIKYKLVVFPEKNNVNLPHYVQKQVDALERSENTVTLPRKYRGQDIKYYEYNDDIGLLFIILGIITAVGVFVIKDRDLDSEIHKRNLEMAADYPEIVSNTMLFLKAGMSFANAWEAILKMNREKRGRYAFREIENTLKKIKGGVSERVALEQYGRNCAVHSYVRFANIIDQNLRRGSEDVCKCLEEELIRALGERKSNALKEGEEAGTKLLAPMIMMLILSIVLIIVPAFMSVNTKL
ncbi:MAG: hypothetical protein E7254_01560 [Lachnospiraceae bacterium]|nr:hypothetical protein [Lachnospiraceae bacterium]